MYAADRKAEESMVHGETVGSELFDDRAPEAARQMNRLRF